MTPLNQDQLNQKKEERKEQIMTAALKIFAENGVKLTKISMISKEAKVSHGLVYHYFNSKDEILYESLEWVMKQNLVEQYFTELYQSSESPLEKIKKFTEYAFTESDSGLSKFVFRIVQQFNDVRELPEHIYVLVENAGESYINGLKPIFLEGQASGEIIDKKVEDLLEVYLSVISAILADDPSYWTKNMDDKIQILLRMVEAR